MFFIGIPITKWYAGKKDWDDSSKQAVIVNLFWVIVDIVLIVVFAFTIGTSLLSDLLVIAIDLILGAVIVSKMYDKEFGESFVFVLVVQIILFVLSLVVAFIIGDIIGLIMVAW